ncbi:MAG: retropepsin-like aspartic protease [Hyphomonadaceae bacterium]
MKKLIFILSIMSVSATAWGQDERPAWQKLDVFNPFSMSAQYEAGEITDPLAHHFAGIFDARNKQDFDLAFQRIEAARSHAEEVGEAQFLRTLTNVKIEMLISSKRYSDIIANVEEFESTLLPEESSEFQYLANLDSKIEMANAPYTLTNIVGNNDRIKITGRINDTETSFLFDTGGDGLTIGPEMSDIVGVKTSSITSALQTTNSSFSNTVGHIDSAQIGLTRFYNHPVNRSNLELDKIWGFNDVLPEAILGISEIRHLGETIVFSTDGKRISELLVLPENPAPTTRGSDINLLLVGQKPIVKLVLGDEVYSCLFDVGAPHSFISQRMFERHKNELDLQLLNRRERRKRFDYKVDKAIDQLLGTLADEPIQLKNVEVRGRANSQCFIGLDAVIQSGGATLSLNQGLVSFGPVDAIEGRR